MHWACTATVRMSARSMCSGRPAQFCVWLGGAQVASPQFITSMVTAAGDNALHTLINGRADFTAISNNENTD